MTGYYDFRAIPDRVSIHCPQCLEKSIFEFAEICRIDRKENIAFFQDNPAFEY